MTGIAGILAPSEAEATSKLDLMLRSMESRGPVVSRENVPGKSDFLAIGSCSYTNDQALDLAPGHASLVADGSAPESLKLEEISGEVGQESFRETFHSSGAFSILAVSEGRLLAARDVLGQKPLYFGADSNGTLAVASLKAALMNIGIHDSVRVPPGQLISLSNTKHSIIIDKALTEPDEVDVSEDEASTRLKTLLIESLSDGVPKDLTLAFSGGLDSSLVANAAMENDLRPELVTIGMKGQPELSHAQEVSKLIGLDITLRELTQNDVLESLPEVLQTIETTDPVIIGVAVPFFFACEIAKEMGSECFLAGQLSDELFAGYARFEGLARKRDFESAKHEILRSVGAASVHDFDPGDKLTSSHNLALKCPFAYLPLVEYALRLPISLKLRNVGDRIVRKYILRRVAADWKLPLAVVDRPKKAVQYSSGVQKVLLKEAKRKRMTLSDFLKSQF